MDTVDSYWEKYAKKHNVGKNALYLGELSFAQDDDETSAFVTALVLSRIKTAMFEALENYELDNEPLPVAGAYYVLTSASGMPCGIIRTKTVSVLPYSEVTWEMAKKEGVEADMESWREAHDRYFEEQSDIMGYVFSPTMSVVYEEFELLHSEYPMV